MGNTCCEIDNQSFPLSGEREGGCFRDHLGTITHLKTGSTVTEYSFDAWGRRHDKDDWTYTLTSEPALFADRGFTGHEYLEDFKLYNMNGRMYDPVVGRFLSPDPYVQDPGFTQSLNRYSYCLNNPLKFTDPSGEFWNWPIIWFGNWLFGVADRAINQKMPLKQAVQQTPIMLSGNYSPSTNQFSNSQVNAQKIATNQTAVKNTLNEINRVRAQDGNEWNGNSDGGVFFPNETSGYKYMWQNANANSKEYAAYITTKGVLVTPAQLNTSGTGEFLKYYNPTWKKGALFVSFKGLSYQVLGGIHTHWRDNGDYGYGFSTDDDYTTIALKGLPFFSMNRNNTIYGQFSDGKYCYPMTLNVTLNDLLNGFYLTKYIMNYGK